MNKIGRDKSIAALAWERDVPLLTHPAILGSMAKVWIISGLLMFALVGGIIGFQEGIKAIIPLAGMIGLIVGGLFVLSLLIMLVVFGNRMHMGFVIDEHGIVVRVIDSRAKIANRFAAMAGALAGKPGVAGAGVIAMHDEERSAVWSSIAGAKYDPRHHTIALRNAWRTVLYVFCTPENYADVAARIAAEIAYAAPRAAWRNPLWKAFGLTVVVVLATLPLFGVPRGFEPHLLAVIVTLCFALATVWLVPPMAWGTLGGIGWIVATMVLRGTETKVNQFTGGASTGFSGIDSTDLVGLTVVAVGLAVLAGLSVAALRGRIFSLLMRDTEEATGGKS